MNDPTAVPTLFAPRDRRALLWLCVAAVCWRWLLAVRTPLPGIDACMDIWLAERLLAGDFAAAVTPWWRPWWALTLAPALLCGAQPVIAAQALACVLGGLVAWPAAVAAERLREGAGVSAAVIVLAAGVPSLAAGAGSALPLHMLLLACGLQCWVAGHRACAALMVAVVVTAGAERLQPALAETAWWALAWQGLRTSWSIAAPLALLSLLPPRPRRIRPLWALTIAALGCALATGGAATWLAVWSPLVAVLAAVGLARLPARLRDLGLVACVAVGFHGAWRGVEPADAVVERQLGSWLLERSPPDGRIVATLPRVLSAAMQRPVRITSAEELLAAAAADRVAFVVLGEPFSRQPTLTSTLAGRFQRSALPRDLAERLAVRRVTVLARR